jgi:hypothetical protein
MCLGTGTTYLILKEAEGPCSACGGLATLDAMAANLCDDPTCPDHGYIRGVE